MRRRTETGARAAPGARAVAAGAVTLLLLAAVQAAAQCPMCGQAVPGAGKTPAQAYATLGAAVAVLLVPVLGFMGAVGALLWKHRH
jgi:hypothetical protein